MARRNTASLGIPNTARLAGSAPNRQAAPVAFTTSSGPTSGSLWTQKTAPPFEIRAEAYRSVSQTVRASLVSMDPRMAWP
jgi:hypothetical protein